MSTSSTNTVNSLLIEAIANDLIPGSSGDRILDFDLGIETLKHSDNNFSDDSMVVRSEGQNVQQLQLLKTENGSAAVTFDGSKQSTINFNDNFAISAAENAPSEATWYSDSVVSTVTLSNSNHIDSLIDGQKWGGTTGTGANLTYSFGEFNTSWYAFSAYPQPGAEPWNGFSPLTATQKNATRNALAAWSEIADLQFTEVTDSETVAGDLRFARSNNPSTAWAYTPSTSPVAGDVWFSNSSAYDTDTKGTYGYATSLHEIGHALGLKHPHETSGSGVVADLGIDTTHNTVMSYRSYFNQPVNAGYSQGFYSTSPLLNDIAAIQYIYGANMNTRSGDSVYSWAPNQQIFEAIWDAGGIDTIDWSNQTSASKINLGPGQWSELGPAYWNGQAWEGQTLAIAYNVTIENASGGLGDDTIIGNDIGNVLRSGDGNDYIDGWNGDDILHGDAGNDTLLGWNGNDALVGGDGNDYLRGEAGNDTITGGAGADIFAFTSPWEGVDTFTDFQWQQGDNIQVSVGGFGMTTGDTSRFTYDGSSLFFDSVQLAFLGNSGFNPSLDIVFA